MWRIEYASNARPGKGQDRLIVSEIEGGNIVGVFDGHGPSFDSAEVCEKAFPRLLCTLTEKNAREGLQAGYAEVASATAKCSGGSTATVAGLWNNGTVVAAVLGDSPILLRLHPNKTKRHDGVFVGRLQSVSSYSFENEMLRPRISQTPILQDWTVSAGGWVAIMSDGVLSSTTERTRATIYELTHLIDKERDVSDVVRTFQTKTHDDASLIVCRFDPGGEGVVAEIPRPKHFIDAASL